MAVSDSFTTVQESQLRCLFFDFAPPRAFHFDQKLSRNVAQVILYYHVTKQFLPCLNWLVTCFRFQNMFWKNINCFRFWWKLTQSIAQLTMEYHVSKDFVPLHFVVGQVLSISWCDLESGRMPCTQKYCIKNMALKM